MASETLKRAGDVDQVVDLWPVVYKALVLVLSTRYTKYGDTEL